MIQGFMTILMVCLGSQEPRYGDRVYRGTRPAEKSDWKVETRARARLKYDDNVFRLDGNQGDRLEQERAADQTSGRFDDMESVWDFVFRPEFRFGASGSSPLGRTLDLYIDVDYDQYVLNPARSHLDLELGVEQRIGPDGRLGLSAGFVPEYFSRNFLADAVDPASDGVSADERRYAEGVSRRWEVELSYRHRFIDRGRSQSFGLDGIVSVGYRDRAYDAPFEGRDREAPYLGLAVRFAHDVKTGGFKALKWGVNYLYEDAESSVGSEVLLLDEPDFGQDLNGDGDATDPNARTVQAVDRSYSAHYVGLYFEVEFSARWDLGIGYERRIRDYSSGQVFDVTHRGREDSRDGFELYATVEISEGWEGRIGYGWQRQDTDRPSDPDGTGEELDYSRNVLYVGVGYSW